MGGDRNGEASSDRAQHGAIHDKTTPDVTHSSPHCRHPDVLHYDMDYTTATHLSLQQLEQLLWLLAVP